MYAESAARGALAGGGPDNTAPINRRSSTARLSYTERDCRPGPPSPPIGGLRCPCGSHVAPGRPPEQMLCRQRNCLRGARLGGIERRCSPPPPCSRPVSTWL